MNNVVFSKKYGKCEKGKEILKIVATERRNFSVSEPNYHTTKFFTENLSAIEMKKKTEILVNKPVHLELSIL